ncbi:hypothetical protein NDU88_002194 [Pleurodeles waltl]|uniref:Uncharacterized protein n=1 Tax=Pleurodeles waltl TaxID=8319 RepID=A0AAV7R9A5_PLEWA|nr:hypothetical protein NDU88_002194 [Pleurodeles waltl]
MEDSAALGLDPGGAQIGARRVQFGGAEVVLAWQFLGAAWALSGGQNCGPGVRLLCGDSAGPSDPLDLGRLVCRGYIVICSEPSRT